jgi:hypothetical protein
MLISLLWPRVEVYGAGNYRWGGIIIVGAIIAIGLSFYVTRLRGRELEVIHSHRAQAPAPGESIVAPPASALDV